MGLVELLVAMMIMAIIGAAAVTSIITMTRSEGVASSVQEDMDTARIAMDRLRRELRGATNVTADSSLRRLQIRVADPNTAVREVVTWELVDTGDGAELRRSEGASPSSSTTLARGLIARDVFAYDRPPPETGSVDVTLEVGSSGTRTFTSEASVRLRNVLPSS